ncbi:Cytoplasmic polyadenylation element-binding protein-like protein [Euroglyphus maynei]|uniref:Cytoplasmic polyadenylation element-binding protein-like protein n=1 Tax=Euroglyphus maynei TaxID=6958 RepID=A0A1Y3BED7_EURMA|nr:Cytoplasmic polyadenylation element-binding protein-like protein [Euroglyphus maynei]
MYSKSAPMSNNFFDDNSEKDKSSIMMNWRLANNSCSFLNPNATDFSPTDNDYQRNMDNHSSSSEKNDSIGEKCFNKIDKGALFALDVTFFDRKEQVSKTIFDQMFGETEPEDNSRLQIPSNLSSTESERINSFDSNSSFGDIVGSLSLNKDNVKNKRASITNIYDDLSFSLDDVLSHCSITKTEESLGSKFSGIDDEQKQKQRHIGQQSSSDIVNRSFFGNVHGLCSLINEPAIVASGHSNLRAPSPTTSGLALFLPQQRANLSAVACVNDELEIRAREHREEASRVDQCQSIFSINRFEFKPQSSVSYSVKVFLGGVPWDMNNEEMLKAFRHFGALAVQRPGKEVRPSRSSRDLSKAGYLYLIFDDSRSVERLISVCKITFDNEGSKFIYSLRSNQSRKIKDVQVIPWDKKDSSHYRPGFLSHDTLAGNNADNAHSSLIDQSRMVFLGALHGMMNSKSIFNALQDIFGPVDYVILETDRFDYPMGFGRAQFTTTSAYQRAINARFVTVSSLRFKKTIQIDPYLEEQKCSQCQIEDGPVYCLECRDYYCRVCFTMKHDEPGNKWHKILMKKISSSINVQTIMAASKNINTNPTIVY